MRQGENGAKSYIKGDYEEFQALRRRKNKPNSKPNKANLPAFGQILEGSDGQIANSKLKLVNLELPRQGTFEKTKPICGRAKLAQSLI